jgi:putative polymerase
VLAAALFNMLLCFANTRGLRASLPLIAGTELAIILAAILPVWRTLLATTLVPLLLVVGWAVAVRLINPAATPKILLDFAIPVAFYAIGKTYGTRQAGDRLVMIVACVVLVVALFEWFAFDTYQQLFNVFQYYVGKGDLDTSHAGDTGTTLGENGMRPGARELLPFLGLHRVGSIFLEPIAVGNFATICIAWLAARGQLDRFAACVAAIAVMLAVFADDRFAISAGIAILIAVYSGASRWRWIAASLPFVTIMLLLVFAAVSPVRIVDNTIGGRLYGSGSYLLDQTVMQWLALTPAAIDMDSGYSYLVDSIGFLVPAGLWLAFAFRRGVDRVGSRFVLAISVYISLSLCVSASCTSIKTAALLWVLAGILAPNTERPVRGASSPRPVSPRSRPWGSIA